MVNAIKSRPPNAPLNRTDVNSCEKSTLWLVLSRLCPCLGLKLQARYSEGSTCDAAGLAQADQSLTRDSQSNPNFANAPADVAKFSLLLKELDLDRYSILLISLPGI